jgi:hypothetical protein
MNRYGVSYNGRRDSAKEKNYEKTSPLFDLLSDGPGNA